MIHCRLRHTGMSGTGRGSKIDYLKYIYRYRVMGNSGDDK